MGLPRDWPGLTGIRGHKSAQTTPDQVRCARPWRQALRACTQHRLAQKLVDPGLPPDQSLTIRTHAGPGRDSPLRITPPVAASVFIPIGVRTRTVFNIALRSNTCVRDQSDGIWRDESTASSAESGLFIRRGPLGDRPAHTRRHHHRKDEVATPSQHQAESCTAGHCSLDHQALCQDPEGTSARADSTFVASVNFIT